MSGTPQNPLRSWRCWAVLILFFLSFYKGWDLLFSAGFIFLLATDRTPYQRTEVSSAFGKFILGAFFLIWLLPIAVCIFGLVGWGNPHLIFPLVLVATGFAVSMLIGFGIYRRAAKRQEILKDL
jgi:hypothetical protein